LISIKYDVNRLILPACITNTSQNRRLRAPPSRFCARTEPSATTTSPSAIRRARRPQRTI